MTLHNKMLSIMKKMKILIGLLVFMLPVLVSAQPADCSSFLATLKAEPPYELDPLSKSAPCISGKTYEFVVPLSDSYEYRFVFYASPAFNNDIHFKMIDLNTNDVVFDVPGRVSEYQEVKKGMTALQPYWDDQQQKTVHPFFVVRPNTATNVKIIMEVEKKPDIIQGCITVAILRRKLASGSFN